MRGSDLQCRIHITKPKYEYKYIQDGDIIIGGVFSVNYGVKYILDKDGKYIPICINPIQNRYIEIQTLLFTIDEINQNLDLLPNITLGYHISYSAIDPVLNDRALYPHYFSTGPDDYIQHVAIAELVEHLGWTWVIILAAGDERGERESQNLRNEITKHGACVDFIGTLTDDINTNTRTLERIQKSTAEVVVLCGEQFRTKIFFVEKIIKEKTLVAPATWIPGYPTSLFNGSLIFNEEFFIFDNSEFEDYVLTIKEDILLKDLLTVASSCLTHDEEKDTIFKNVYSKIFRNCSGSKLLPFYGRSYRVYTAVYGFAHAEHDMLSSSGQFCNKHIHKNIHRKQLHYYLRNAHFKDPLEQNVSFTELGFLNLFYSIFSMYSSIKYGMQRIYVGTYTWSGHKGFLEIYIQSIIWKKNTNNQTLKSQCSASCPPGYRKVPQNGAPPCCYDCASCSEGEVSNLTDMENCVRCLDYEWPNHEKTMCIEKPTDFLSYDRDSLTLIFNVLTVILSAIAVSILGIFISFRDTPVVKANNRNLSFILLVSIKLSFLSVFLFLGCPIDITCMLRQTSFGITFSIAVSCVLAKTIMVFIVFKATKPGSSWKTLVGAKLANSIVLFFSMIQIIINVIWLGISPPFAEQNIHSEPRIIIIQCNEGSVVAFYIVLSYMGLLASVSFIVAFLARTLPDSFNEAKYITFSMLLFCSVWITMIPAYLSTKGKYMVAVEIFAILTSNCGLLFCIFLPKCYIILLKPEMNTKQYLLGNKKKLIVTL
ncbi:hypothetical protein XELAEV_18008724mg [Xenopus laevis]|uniref:G-protein coupled receptors family 3 profile domain-containing protein n=1 Tax=Xenopus laevis TaxID=8355 RepID=A0A974DS60_XENLA|nr:hypothetical protein XELAEV_18008724mg [Xenopus laevis]